MISLSLTDFWKLRQWLITDILLDFWPANDQN
jgi:hypothetical protein